MMCVRSLYYVYCISRTISAYLHMTIKSYTTLHKLLIIGADSLKNLVYEPDCVGTSILFVFFLNYFISVLIRYAFI